MKLLLAATAFAVIAAPAFAADLRGAEQVYVPEIASSSFDWTGFYAGINGGYGWAELDTGTAVFDDLEGLLGGAQVGYNYDFGGFVLGVEGDVQLADIEFEQLIFGSITDSASLDAFGSVRVRAGVAIDRFLPYATAGVALGHVTSELSGPGFDFEFDSKYIGYTVGAGVEFAVTDNVTLKTEYLYSDFGDGDFGFGDVALTSHVVRAGLNYKF